MTPILTYLANSIRANGKTVPYSLVAALPLNAVVPSAGAPKNAIVLNDWTARDLGAKAGDSVSLDYYVWKDDGRLVTESSDFVVSSVVPIAGLAADRQLAPAAEPPRGADHADPGRKAQRHAGGVRDQIARERLAQQEPHGKDE